MPKKMNWTCAGHIMMRYISIRLSWKLLGVTIVLQWTNNSWLTCIPHNTGKYRERRVANDYEGGKTQWCWTRRHRSPLLIAFLAWVGGPPLPLECWRRPLARRRGRTQMGPHRWRVIREVTLRERCIGLTVDCYQSSLHFSPSPPTHHHFVVMKSCKLWMMAEWLISLVILRK